MARRLFPHTAHCRHLGAVHRRPRHCPSAHQRQSADVHGASVPMDRARPPVRHPSASDHHGDPGARRGLGAAADAVRPLHSRHRRQRESRTALGHSGGQGEACGLRHHRPMCRSGRTDSYRHQLVQRRQSRGPRQRARRDRRRRRRRHASQRRQGNHRRNTARGADDPARSLYAACQRRSAGGSIGRQGGHHRLRRMAAAAESEPLMRRVELIRTIGTYGVVIALAALVLFGFLRYDRFLSTFNVMSVLRYNSMFALVSLGMCFVIMTGGIDLSVGAVAAMGSVASALASPYGLAPGLAAGVFVGLAAGAINGLLVTRAHLLPFIATLATMLAASGTALLLAGNQTVSVSYDSGFIAFGQGNFSIFPVPAVFALLAYMLGSVVLNFTSFGRTVLAIGGGEDATRLMGLEADRVKFIVYLAGCDLARLVGFIIGGQFCAG